MLNATPVVNLVIFGESARVATAIVKLYLRWLTKSATNVANLLIQAAPATDQARLRHASDVGIRAISRVTAHRQMLNATPVVNLVMIGESARVATAIVKLYLRWLTKS